MVRRRVPCRIPGVDLKVVESAFGWLDFRLLSAQEREGWLARIWDLLALALSRLPSPIPSGRHADRRFSV